MASLSIFNFFVSLIFSILFSQTYNKYWPHFCFVPGLDRSPGSRDERTCQKGCATPQTELGAVGGGLGAPVAPRRAWPHWGLQQGCPELIGGLSHGYAHRITREASLSWASGQMGVWATLGPDSFRTPWNLGMPTPGHHHEFSKLAASLQFSSSLLYSFCLLRAPISRFHSFTHLSTNNFAAPSLYQVSF